jgi:putative endonuclease
MAFWAYLLRCADGSYYAGHTDDIDRRISEHQLGHFPGYTHKRRPVTLVWSDYFLNRDDAKASERQIKGWSRAKKEALIAGDYARISMLAKNAGARSELALSPAECPELVEGPFDRLRVDGKVEN